MEELGETTEDIGEGGSDGADSGGLFHGGVTARTTVRARDMGGHPKAGAGVEWVSTRGGEEDYRETGAEREERRVALPISRGGHAVSRADGQSEIHSKQAEHGHAVHCDVTASGPVRGGQSEGGREGVNAVVESYGH